MAPTQTLVVDAAAELVARLAPIGPNALDAVDQAFQLAATLDYLAQLRPFARWLESALARPRYAGDPPPLPTCCPGVASLTATLGLEIHLGLAVERARADAVEPGLTSPEFKESSRRFLDARRTLTVEHEFTVKSPHNRELEYLRHGLAHALKTLLPDAKLGGTVMAPILAARRCDPPIVRYTAGEPCSVAIARRAKRYSHIWQHQAPRADTADEQFMEVDGEPELDATSVIDPSILFMGDGHAVIHRPAHVPAEAVAKTRRRGARRVVEAHWRENGKTRKLKLAALRAGGARSTRPQ